MTTRTNTLEGGSDGTAVTVANSGGSSGDAFDTLVASTGSGVYDDAQAMHGTLSLNFSGASGVQWVMAWTLNDIQWSIRLYLRITSFTSAQDFFQVRNSGGQASTFGLNASRAVQLKNASGTSIETLAALSLDTWYRIEWQGQRGTTTANGTSVVQVYLGDSGTLVTQSTTGSGNVNTGTTNITQFRLCKLTSASAINAWVDSITVRDDTMTALGIYSASDSVSVPAATGTGAAVAPAIAASSVVSPPTATGAGAALAPSVTAGSSIAVPTAAGTAEAMPPAISAGSAVAVPAAAGTADAHPPAVSAGSNIAISAAIGSAEALAPTVSISSGAVVAIPAATGTAQAVAPAVTASSTVTISAASGVGEALAPTVSISVAVSPPAAAGALAALAPAVEASSVVVVPAALGVAEAVAPVVSASTTVPVPGAVAVGAAWPPIVFGSSQSTVTLTLGAAAWRPIPLAVQAAAWAEPDLTIGDVTWE